MKEWEIYAQENLTDFLQQVSPCFLHEYSYSALYPGLMSAEDIQKIPAVVFMTCEFDFMRRDHLEFIDRLKKAGKLLDHQDMPRVLHGYHVGEGLEANEYRNEFVVAFNKYTNNIWPDIPFLKEKLSDWAPNLPSALDHLSDGVKQLESHEICNTMLERLLFEQRILREKLEKINS